jgi:uncharacterized protein YukE
MATRVLATPEAAAAISQIENILNSGLTQTIQNLNQQGGMLSDPAVWDGNLSDDFRNNVWPACSQALNNAHTQLQDLQTKLKAIHANIMQAGGNPA